MLKQWLLQESTLGCSIGNIHGPYLANWKVFTTICKISCSRSPYVRWSGILDDQIQGDQTGAAKVNVNIECQIVIAMLLVNLHVTRCNSLRIRRRNFTHVNSETRFWSNYIAVEERIDVFRRQSLIENRKSKVPWIRFFLYGVIGI